MPDDSIWEDDVRDNSADLPVAAPEVMKTVEDAKRALAERGGLSEERTPRLPAPPRSARARKVERGDGSCRAYAPKGTKCKLCGKVHPL